MHRIDSAPAIRGLSEKLLMPPQVAPTGRPSRARIIPVLLATVTVGLTTASCAAPPHGELTALHVDEIASTADLPVEVNDRVTRWMQRFLGNQRDMFDRFLSRETLYGDMIREKLRSRDMPEDLLYLAMIESGFYPRARSKVEAIGVWQFMGPTAMQYGLRIDDYVDERRDPIRATDAALDYLEVLYERFGSWYLAAAAYNAGPGRVARVLANHADSRTGDEELYWEIIDHLPPETREYVPRLIAATLLARRANELGLASNPAEPYAFDRVWVPGGTGLAIVARTSDVPVAVLRELNPHLIRGMTPPGGSYELRVPRGQSGTVVAGLSGAPDRHLADDD